MFMCLLDYVGFVDWFPGDLGLVWVSGYFKGEYWWVDY